MTLLCCYSLWQKPTYLGKTKGFFSKKSLGSLKVQDHLAEVSYFSLKKKRVSSVCFIKIPPKPFHVDSIKVKGKISQTQTNYQNVQKKNIELTKEIQQLLQKLEDVTKKYEDQIKVLKGRVSSSTQEQQNASEHFRSLMSTNDQLQQQLQTLQESLGKKDFQLHNLLTERYTCCSELNESSYLYMLLFSVCFEIISIYNI